MPKAQVIPMPNREKNDTADEVTPASCLTTPWAALGFKSERDMLIDDLKTLDNRIKSPSTTATAVAALSKRKQEVFEQIKALDAGDDEDDGVVDDSEDETWDAGS